MISRIQGPGSFTLPAPPTFYHEINQATCPTLKSGTLLFYVTKVSVCQTLFVAFHNTAQGETVFSSVSSNYLTSS